MGWRVGMASKGASRLDAPSFRGGEDTGDARREVSSSKWSHRSLKEVHGCPFHFHSRMTDVLFMLPLYPTRSPRTSLHLLDFPITTSREERLCPRHAEVEEPAASLAATSARDQNETSSPSQPLPPSQARRRAMFSGNNALSMCEVWDGPGRWIVGVVIVRHGISGAGRLLCFGAGSACRRARPGGTGGMLRWYPPMDGG